MERNMSTLEIYGTLGPSCADPAILRQMFETGITGMRLNLSHGTLAHSAGMIEAFHKAADEAGVHPSLLIDMQGPELRIGTIEKSRILMDGETVILARRSAALSPAGAIPVPGEIFEHYEDGMTLLIDDGKRKLKTTRMRRLDEGDLIEARVITGGALLSRKSIAVEGRAITGNTLTEQDILNLQNAEAYGVTDVMQPFVRGAADLREVRKAMQESGAGRCRLFAKIENTEGLAAVEEIIPLTDMVVIARGDLGNAVPLWHLPYVQKEISHKCRKAGVPFMVVTQMLASMEKAPVPTRAEVSDIFNAVVDGASSVMVTGETASGSYPLQVAEYLVRTAREGLRYRETL